jgi:hypothetical protein
LKKWYIFAAISAAGIIYIANLSENNIAVNIALLVMSVSIIISLLKREISL